MTRVSEKELIDILCNNATKIIHKHGLDSDEFLPIRQILFPHGRADAVIYGLYKGLFIMPIAVEVKKKVLSCTELLYFIDQIRKTYEYAFTYIYLAIGKIQNNIEELVKRYLLDVGYGLIRICDKDIDIIIEATPKKPYRSRRDYAEVASRGMLYISTRRALLDLGFSLDDIKVTSQWMGLNLSLIHI